MPKTSLQPALLQAHALRSLFDALQVGGYQILGPTVRQGAIVYSELRQPEDLPVGWREVQEAGQYRLQPREDGFFFGFNLGPHTWKQFLHPPEARLWQAERSEGLLQIQPEIPDMTKRAFLGVRSCELAAISRQDRVLMQGPYCDPVYRARRQNCLLIAVNCSQAAATCFCVSMDTGPQVQQGFDLALTELLTEDSHCFLVETGSEKGADLLSQLPYQAASATAVAQASEMLERTRSSMGRVLDTQGLQADLVKEAASPIWDDIAARCLACANCTLVCPTCFCTTVTDHLALDGQSAERRQRWDSCFSLDFTHLPGGSVRSSVKSRYRQWLTHKLATWHDQFGESGCVGCGRCIAWCPAGIDLTAEASRLREAQPC